MKHPSHPSQVSQDRLTPSAIEVLLWYHTRADIHPRHNAPAVVSARNQFIILDVIHPVHIKNGEIVPVTLEEDSVLFTTTERGKQWVDALCSTTCPETS